MEQIRDGLDKRACDETHPLLEVERLEEPEDEQDKRQAAHERECPERAFIQMISCAIVNGNSEMRGYRRAI